MNDEFYERGGLWQLARAMSWALGFFSGLLLLGGPHFHVIGFGPYAPRSDVFERETGWVYKNLGDRAQDSEKIRRVGVIVDEIELTADIS